MSRVGKFDKFKGSDLVRHIVGPTHVGPKGAINDRLFFAGMPLTQIERCLTFSTIKISLVPSHKVADPPVYRSGGLKLELLYQVGNVGISVWNIARLQREHVNVGFFAQCLFQGRQCNPSVQSGCYCRCCKYARGPYWSPSRAQHLTSWGWTGQVDPTPE